MMSVLAKTLGVVLEKTLFRPARVASTTALGGFRLLELRGESLRASDWSPGDKLRVKVGDLDLRTYTPFFWDEREGSVRLLAWLPGRGPGSDWAASARAGDPVHIKGPDGSLKLSSADRHPVVFFGDETAVGAAAALRHARPTDDLRFVFEFAEPESARPALAAFGLEASTCVAKREDASHLEEVAARIATWAGEWKGPGHVFLVGDQASLKGLKARLDRDAALAKAHAKVQVKMKVYWREGRRGLD